jgi:hypothetical protein
MAFRLIVSEAPDLTTIQVVGRLGDDTVAVLMDACGGARRPVVLDLSELTGASNAGVLLLGRLRRERCSGHPRSPTTERRDGAERELTCEATE